MKLSIRTNKNNNSISVATQQKLFLNDTQITEENGALSLFPINSVVLRYDDTCPAEIYGGEWEQIAQGRALYGAGELNGQTFAVGDKPNAGLPNITGNMYMVGATGVAMYITDWAGALYRGSQTAKNQVRDYAGGTTHPRFYFDASRGETKMDGTLKNEVFGKSNTVQPNALVVKVWIRVK